MGDNTRSRELLLDAHHFASDPERRSLVELASARLSMEEEEIAVRRARLRVDGGAQLRGDGLGQRRLRPVALGVGNLEQIVACAAELAGQVRRCVEADCLPITLGGDHSVALGSISGVAARSRRNQARSVPCIMPSLST